MRNLLPSLNRRAFSLGLASVVLRRPLLLLRVSSLRVIVFIALRASYY